jgi:hypothetical protein
MLNMLKVLPMHLTRTQHVESIIISNIRIFVKVNIDYSFKLQYGKRLLRKSMVAAFAALNEKTGLCQ